VAEATNRINELTAEINTANVQAQIPGKVNRKLIQKLDAGALR
jgi:hypothetical protein